MNGIKEERRGEIACDGQVITEEEINLLLKKPHLQRFADQYCSRARGRVAELVQ